MRLLGIDMQAAGRGCHHGAPGGWRGVIRRGGVVLATLWIAPGYQAFEHERGSVGELTSSRWRLAGGLFGGSLISGSAALVVSPLYAETRQRAQPSTDPLLYADAASAAAGLYSDSACLR